MKALVSDLPVMKATCRTCPFKKDKKGRWRDTELANKVIQRTLFNAQQICHHTHPKESFRCKGSYDYNKEIYLRLGFEELLHPLK